MFKRRENLLRKRLNKKLKYQISEPTSNKNDLQVIFLLHGYGSNDEDLFSLKDFIPSDYIIISLRAPISIGFNSYAWYSINFEKNFDRWINNDEAINSKNIIISDILLHLKDFGLENKRISLLGFSQGAILSWCLGLEYPQLIKNILPLSGFYNSEITNCNFNSKFKLNCYASHGIKDEIIPIEWARKSIQLLNKDEINIMFKEYDSGHEINHENLIDIIDWLKKN